MADLPPARIAEAQAQRAREVQAIIIRMAGELAGLEAQLTSAADQHEQAQIETEIVHLSLALSQLRRGHYQDHRELSADKPPAPTPGDR